MLYIRLALNKETRKYEQIKFDNVMTVLIFTNGPEVWATKKVEAVTETAEVELLRSVAGYRRKDQIRKIQLRKS